MKLNGKGDGLVVHSFSGDDIIAAKDYVRAKLGLPPFTPKSKSNGKDRKAIIATYDYTDEAGDVFQVVRFEPKTFRQRKPDGNGGWSWKLGDVRRVLFKLPELIEAIAAGHPVFIVEGEKDVLTLNKLGVVATTNAGGAGKWRPEFSEALRGADVILDSGQRRCRLGARQPDRRAASWCGGPSPRSGAAELATERVTSPIGLQPAARANSSTPWSHRLPIGSRRKQAMPRIRTRQRRQRERTS